MSESRFKINDKVYYIGLIATVESVIYTDQGLKYKVFWWGESGKCYNTVLEKELKEINSSGNN